MLGRMYKIGNARCPFHWTFRSYLVWTPKVDNLGTKVDMLETKVGRIERSQQSILDLVKAIDQQLREHGTHSDRIARLERSVFRR
jgi:hypothetical protein